MSLSITIKTTTNQIINLDIKPDDTIENIKAMIQFKENISSYDQRLIFAGKELEDNKTAEASKIKNQSILILVLKK